MKAILINAKNQTVSTVTLPDDDCARADAIRAHLGCLMFDIVRLATGNDAVLVDDEGLLGDLHAQSFFILKGYPSPLAGNGLVMGADDEGESCDPVISESAVRDMVRFIPTAHEAARAVTVALRDDL